LRRIAVIIPTLNEAAIIADTLAQFDTLPGQWDVIVADSGSEDGTPVIAVTHGARVVDVPAGRGAGMNAGAAAATSGVLLFLHADTMLPQQAHDLISTELANPAVAATAFRLTTDGTGWRYRLIPLVSRLRVRVQRTFFGDQAIAVRRADFERIGGYPEPLLMEDVSLSRRLRREGKLHMLPAEVRTSARRFERGGMLRTLAFMSCLQLAYSLGVSANRLARLYRNVR
jgi:uncharacterized protein